MNIVGKSELWSISVNGSLRQRACFNVRKGEAYLVSDFLELATKVAALQFKNPEHVLIFRGQRNDHKRKTIKEEYLTTLLPTILRRENGTSLRSHVISERFTTLRYAERLLVEAYERRKLAELDRLKREQLLRWAILQHYEVCRTPLLDVTSSLRIAASFAFDRNSDRGFVFVLGVPNISGAITASAEAGLQIVRLASVCPPDAVRPHIQEGYLLGHYPEIRGYDEKQEYPIHETDFGRRLVAKFELRFPDFWGNKDFPLIPKAALYPDKDPLHRLTQHIKTALYME